MPKPGHISTLEFSQITKHVFIGTNTCCQMHFAKELLKRGVTCDISLEEVRIDMPFGVTAYVWLPIKDHTPPTKMQIEVGIEALDAMIRRGQKVFIHCKNGHGRAPTFFAAYLMLKKGLQLTDALALITAKRPNVHLSNSQLAFLKRLQQS